MVGIFMMRGPDVHDDRSVFFLSGHKAHPLVKYTIYKKHNQYKKAIVECNEEKLIQLSSCIDSKRYKFGSPAVSLQQRM